MPRFWLGLRDVLRRDRVGHDAYLFGEYRRFGWWYFFPVVLALKTPLALLMLSAAGAWGSRRAAWQQRLAGIDWAAGDPQRGLRVFEKRACHRCHAGSGRLGPSLAGAAARFSRDDLFTAIIDPSKDVAPLYHTVSVVTHDGQSYHGLAVYESSQAVLLQVSAETTLRFAGEEIAAMRPSRQSLMPVGLLNDLTDQDLADLYAYLQTLRKE